MMKTIAIGLALAATSPVVAQDRKPDVPTHSSASAMTVAGCLRGTVLELVSKGSTRALAEALRASEFNLEGPKDLMQLLKADHNGHHIEVTGVAKIPPSTTDEQIGVQTTDLGRAGTITVGRRQQKGFIPTPPRPVRLVVQSFKHLGDSCASR